MREELQMLVDACAYAALVTDMSKIGGEAVAQVDHGGSQFLEPQKPSNCDTRDGMKMPRVVAGSEPFLRDVSASTSKAAAAPPSSPVT